jgi:hypothetical protein
LELSKYLEFSTTKHDVVTGTICGAVPFKRTCLDDVCPMLWGKLFKEVLNTSIPLITLRNSKTVSAWKMHTVAVFPRHKDRKLLHNFLITAGFSLLSGRLWLRRTYTCFS